MDLRELDEKLSEAQLVLRDGHHDHLSRAIADVRNLMTLHPPQEERPARDHETG